MPGAGRWVHREPSIEFRAASAGVREYPAEMLEEAHPRMEALGRSASARDDANHTDASNAAHMKHDIEAVSCSICFQESPCIAMPCCGREGSSTVFCRACIEIICRRTQGIGKCPSCRAYIQIEESGLVCRAEQQDWYCICCQNKQTGTNGVQEGLCDACLLGSHYTLRYECDRCHKSQHIPHPMWRYQPSVTEFTSITWPCLQGCAEQTHWRVAVRDAHRVPDFDCPDEWGRKEEWLDKVLGNSFNKLRGDPSGSEAPECIVS